MATVTLTGAPAGITGVRHNGKRYVLDQPVENVSAEDVKVLKALKGHQFDIPTTGPSSTRS